MEYKNFEIKTAEDDDRTFEGIVSVFGIVDEGGDIVEKGAFTESLENFSYRVRGLWQHDVYTLPIGVHKELREVSREELPVDTQLAYPDATGGLYIKGRILPTTLGDDLLVCIREGAVKEMSFGYIAKDYEPIKNSQGFRVGRKLTQIDLFEWSPVNWGMNSATSIAAKEAALTQENITNMVHQKRLLRAYIDELKKQI